MKIDIQIFKNKFKITQKEVEDYFRWYWMPEPPITDKKSIEQRLERLRKMVEWVKKIDEKYGSNVASSSQWVINSAAGEITIK